MNRRGFLAALAGAALDPERLLWIPGKKLISIPRPAILALGDIITFGSGFGGRQFRILQVVHSSRNMRFDLVSISRPFTSMESPVAVEYNTRVLS